MVNSLGCMRLERSQIRFPALSLLGIATSDLGQVVHTHVPLSPKSITWYKSQVSDVLHVLQMDENRARQLYKNISMLFMFPVKDGKLSTGVNATFNASCYG